MNGRVMATFSKEDSPQARELLKFTVHRAPGVQAALKEACDGLLTDYWGDFLHIITQEHQVRRLPFLARPAEGAPSELS
jgi:hypothetical protein